MQQNNDHALLEKDFANYLITELLRCVIVLSSLKLPASFTLYGNISYEEGEQNKA